MSIGQTRRRHALHGQEFAIVSREDQPARGLLLRVTDANHTRQAILSKGSKGEHQLSVGLDDRLKIARLQVQVGRIAIDHFDFLGLGYFSEVLLHLQRFVLLVVGDAEDASERFARIVAFGEDHEACHVGNRGGLSIHVVSHFEHVRYTLSIDQPESAKRRRLLRSARAARVLPSGNGGRESGAIVRERQRRVSGDIIELSGVRATCNTA